MNIGYIKTNQPQLYLNSDFQKKLNISKLYTDRPGEHTNLREMLKYVRQGDNIVVEDIQHLSKSIGEFTEFAITLKQQGIHVICKHQQIDTSTLIWDEISKQLKVFIKKSQEQQSAGRIPRHIEDLDKCFDLVAQVRIQRFVSL